MMLMQTALKLFLSPFIGIMTVLSLDAAVTEDSFSISEIPISVVYTDDSILHDPENFSQLYINDKPRWATCSEVSWFHDNRYLATVNLLGDKLTTYAFQSGENIIKPLQVITEGLAHPINLSFSHDGQMAAVTNSKNGSITIYQVSLNTHMIHPTPRLTIQHEADTVVHGVRFSPNSKFLAYTSVDEPGCVRIYKIITAHDDMEAIHASTFSNIYYPLKPKGLSFTQDGKFILICFADNASGTPSGEASSKLAVFTFDMKNGIINENPISIVDENSGLCCPEDVILSQDASHIIVTNQGDHSIALYPFDPINGTIGKESILLKSPLSQLNFPHGIAISSDNKYLAVTNLGDDKFNIYSVEDTDPSPLP